MFAAMKLLDFKAERDTIKIINLPLDKIRPNPYQPRKFFDVFLLNELADSITKYGVMQPISVRLINGCSYEIVSGERRLRASKLAGLETIPAIVVNVDDDESAIRAMVENLQRQNLNFLEEAEGYLSLINDYGMTQEELAIKVGKNQSTIANKIRVLKLPIEVRRIIMENNLTERHSRALTKIPDLQIQKAVLCQIIENDLNVKKTDELVAETLSKLRAGQLGISERKIKRSFNDIRLFTNTIKQSVDIIRKAGVVASYDVEEKDDFYEINIKIHYKDGKKKGNEQRKEPELFAKAE